MLLTTLTYIRCPNCLDGMSGELSLHEVRTKKSQDILFGTLACKDCGSNYPILAGIALLVGDVDYYLRAHVKGISSFVADSDIPLLYRESFLQAKEELLAQDSDEDLESERVNALYFMNHYVKAAKAKSKPWWRSKKSFSPEIDYLVKNFWDKGPFSKIADWTKSAKNQKVIELACGVGGLALALEKKMDSYLGIDSSFTSIALARHINLGAPYPLSLQTPQDLFLGSLTGKVDRPKRSKGNAVDFVVGDVESLPVAKEVFDLAVALNAIDVIEEPGELPRLQHSLLKDGGIAIMSSPFLWDKTVVENLRVSLPRKIRSSTEAVEYLYENSGFKILCKLDHVPWLFLEHFRKIGVYSTYLMAARKITDH